MEREEFCKKCRYLGEIATFLGVSKETVKSYCVFYGVSLPKKIRLYPPKLVRKIVDLFYLDIDEY